VNTRQRFAGKVVAVAFLLSVVVVACGGDPYSGTWKSVDVGVDQSGASHRTTLVIAKSGDAWTVTDSLGKSFRCEEIDDRLVKVEGAREVLVRDGDHLVLKLGEGINMAFSKQ
jgi:hypothetical protein